MSDWIFHTWPKRGLGSSLATSVVVHGVILFVGLVGCGMAGDAVFPTDAIEVAVGNFKISQGQRRSSSSKSIPKQTASPVDMAVKEKKVKAEMGSAEGTQSREGQGGDASRSVGRALTERESYLARARERIHDALVYPRSSKNLGETGRVKVRLAVERDGRISEVDITEPSAFERLNTAAVDTVRRVAQLDPLPASYHSRQMVALLPIDFDLK